MQLESGYCEPGPSCLFHNEGWRSRSVGSADTNAMCQINGNRQSVKDLIMDGNTINLREMGGGACCQSKL